MNQEFFLYGSAIPPYIDPWPYPCEIKKEKDIPCYDISHMGAWDSWSRLVELIELTQDSAKLTLAFGRIAFTSHWVGRFLNYNLKYLGIYHRCITAQKSKLCDSPQLWRSPIVMWIQVHFSYLTVELKSTYLIHLLSCSALTLFVLGHFLLTNLLLEKMKRTARETGIEGRIVNLSSIAHLHTYEEGIRFDKINDQNG